ncbi:hypothetical protein J6590_096374 [Homalodisca vitripennis]|nr:hypothetical protein J6590_096374 [Homalodisca vitripennis]
MERGTGTAVNCDNVDMWYCLGCRKHTHTLNIKKTTFLTKKGGRRPYHRGLCAVCDRNKSNMRPW